ncbi:hypothetical protein SAMN05216353_11665 [Halobacillus alkaliphilus]|uniref:Uncharacterized protein n=1 Tax=Halobacillus alkaliphilus TaxID=396056 RepID=A0A1I2N6T3_9BACI|nr:hypothetical protein [Halobacillus alkaliphilus]SFF97216.1 hypothetical protein SAMN05216353_11665 [Halobacillus alkaliphilus]
MNDKQERIPYPNESELDREVKCITSQGLETTPSFFVSISRIVREVGMKHIFRDATEMLFILIMAVISLLGFLTVTSGWLPWREVNMYVISFTGAPFIYGVLVYFFFIRKKQEPTFEVEMTCKYNLRIIATVRMLLFSFISLMVNGLVIFAMTVPFEFDVWFAFLLSVAALFLCSTAYLYIQHSSEHVWSPVVVIGGWIVGNVFLAGVLGSKYDLFLLQIPFYIYLVIAVGAAFLYLQQTVRFLHKTKAGGGHLC